eukprot:7387716-Prymnesium_polylepis.2
MQARADLAAAQLDELADVLAQWPRMREEEVEARRRLEPGKVHKLLLAHGCQLDKAAPTIAEHAQPLLPIDVVGQETNFADQLDDEHGERKEKKEQEEACYSEAER